MRGDFFRKFANRVSQTTGSPSTFVVAVLIIVVWAFTGPIFSFSNTWQLIINTGTTIVTFLMVFLIQNTQNRDSKAMQIKLDELIRATKARDAYIDIENLSDEELSWLSGEFKKIHDKAPSKELELFHSRLETARTHRLSISGSAKQVVSSTGKAVEKILKSI